MQLKHSIQEQKRPLWHCLRYTVDRLGTIRNPGMPLMALSRLYSALSWHHTGRQGIRKRASWHHVGYAAVDNSNQHATSLAEDTSLVSITASLPP